jgi:hypothetical protein
MPELSKRCDKFNPQGMKYLIILDYNSINSTFKSITNQTIAFQLVAYYY